VRPSQRSHLSTVPRLSQVPAVTALLSGEADVQGRAGSVADD